MCEFLINKENISNMLINISVQANYSLHNKYILQANLKYLGGRGVETVLKLKQKKCSSEKNTQRPIILRNSLLMAGRPGK